MKYFDPIVVSVVMLMEPILACAMGVAVGVDAVLGWFSIGGSLLIIVGTALVIVSNSSKTNRLTLQMQCLPCPQLFLLHHLQENIPPFGRTQSKYSCSPASRTRLKVSRWHCRLPPKGITHGWSLLRACVLCSIETGCTCVDVVPSSWSNVNVCFSLLPRSTWTVVTLSTSTHSRAPYFFSSLFCGRNRAQTRIPAPLGSVECHYLLIHCPSVYLYLLLKLFART